MFLMLDSNKDSITQTTLSTQAYQVGTFRNLIVHNQSEVFSIDFNICNLVVLI